MPLSACGLMPFTVVQDINGIFPYKEWYKPFCFLLAVANILQSSVLWFASWLSEWTVQ